MLLEAVGFDFENDEVIFVPTMERMLSLPNLLQRLCNSTSFHAPRFYFVNDFVGNKKVVKYG